MSLEIYVTRVARDERVAPPTYVRTRIIIMHPCYMFIYTHHNDASLFFDVTRGRGRGRGRGRARARKCARSRVAIRACVRAAEGGDRAA